MRIRILILLAFLLTSCGSIHFKFNSMNSLSNRNTLKPNRTVNVKTYTTNHQVFANLDPMDFGLNHGNYLHCRIHGFHDLTWFDPLYSPYFCKPTQGFLSGSHWNSSWNWNNWMWNNNWMWHHNQNTWNNWMWRPYLGNAHYGNWNGWNTWSPYGPLYGYNGRNIYNGRRSGNVNRRWRVNQPTRRNNVTPRNTRPTRTNVTPTRTRPTRLNPQSRPVRTEPRTRPTRMDPPSRPVRTEPRTRPARLNPPTRPVRTRTVPNAPSRTSGNTTTPSRRRQQ